jgi:hypothetical protein
MEVSNQLYDPAPEPVWTRRRRENASRPAYSLFTILTELSLLTCVKYRPLSRSGRGDEEKNTSLFREWNAGPPAYSLFTILTELSLLTCVKVKLSLCFF